MTERELHSFHLAAGDAGQDVRDGSAQSTAAPSAYMPGPEDAVHAALVKAIERKERAHLWTPADAITFTPRVLPTVFGDGRALFSLATINQRPAYWVIRGCSTWGSGFDRETASGAEFAELVDDILTALEDAFGSGRCGYSGNNLFWPKRERMQNCQCEECSDGTFRARWPMVDGDGGCSWSRIDWPKGFDTDPNPLSWRGNLLRAVIAKALGTQSCLNGSPGSESTRPDQPKLPESGGIGVSSIGLGAEGEQ